MGDDSTIGTTNLPALPEDPGQFILYQTEDGQTRVEVRVFRDTVWLSQKAMAGLFQKDVRTINEHIRNVFSEGELCEEAVIRKFRITASDGKQYDTLHYNLDVITSVGYRVKSCRGTQFRIWATQRLQEYLIKGFALDDQRLKQVSSSYLHHWAHHTQFKLEKVRPPRNSAEHRPRRNPWETRQWRLMELAQLKSSLRR